MLDYYLVYSRKRTLHLLPVLGIFSLHSVTNVLIDLWEGYRFTANFALVVP